MTRNQDSRPVVRMGLAALVVAALVGGSYALWLVRGPGPFDFDPGTRAPPAPPTASRTDPTGVPTELAQADLIARGEYLAHAADCTACHTTDDGPAFAGGLGFNVPFGTIYSTNITPDLNTGIGKYTDQDFLRVMHEGVAPRGRHLYPAMPYASYTYLTDTDALAIKAYLFSLPAVTVNQPVNTLTFPFNQRWLMTVWSAMFNPDRRFAPNSERTATWNRGAYLAEALAHCSECHTPRTFAFSLDHRHKFAGNTEAGWRAYNITSDTRTGIGDWSPDQLAQYIGGGHAEGRGAAGGPMGEAVDHSFRYLTAGDIAAIVEYVRTVPPISSRDLPAVRTAAAPMVHSEGIVGSVDARGKEVFEGACAGCHGWTGISPVINEATLIADRAVNDPSAANVVQVILSGTRRTGVYMPAFGAAYSDAEIAAVANYVTARFGAQPSTVTAAEVSHMRGLTSR